MTVFCRCWLPVDEMEISFLMPKYGSENVIEETPKHLPDDLSMVDKNKLIGYSVKLVENQRKEKVLSKTVPKYSGILFIKWRPYEI